MKIFISYRRDDTAGYAGRLFDYLSAHFGAENVFMDIDTIEPGEDFRKVVSRAMGTCDVVLVMIGKQWLNISDASGRRRLDDPRDLVRMEVGAALANRRIRVIPVLVRDAGMPGEHELPEGLKELTWRNALELSDSRFQHDARKLIGVIERIGVKTGPPPAQPAPVPQKAAPPSRSLLLFGGGGAILIVLAMLGLFLWNSFNGLSTPPSETPEATSEVLPPATTIATTLPMALPSETTSPVPTVVASDTPSPEPSPTATITPEDVPSHLVRLVDDYYACMNEARDDIRSDYDRCWNMLSDRPGEFQDSLNRNSGGKEAFISWLLPYKVSYAIYYCIGNEQQFVHVDYRLHRQEDVSRPYTEMYMIEYRFAQDDEGWRITSGFARTARSQFCESSPRIDRLAIFQ